ncbi:MAG: MMPL family transporter [Candidatus Aenigmatarchaeota archaeon]
MKVDFKKLIILPIALVILSLAIIVNNILSIGFIIDRDVELSGGLRISIPINESVDVKKVESLIKDSHVRIARGYNTNILIIQTKDVNESKVIEKLKDIINFDEEKIEIGKIDAAIGDVFWRQAGIAIILSFVTIFVIIFFAFRSLIPSLSMVLSTIFDIIITIAFLSILNIKLSLPVLAGLLMIIGYSVDTDVLLATRMLKRSGDIEEKVFSAIRTGITMTLTSIAALISIYIFSGGTVLRDISLTLIIGLCADIINTWITNTNLFLFWLGRRESKSS